MALTNYTTAADEYGYVNRGGPQSHQLAHCAVTKRIRVSTAAIYREDRLGMYWQVETWIFSNDARQKSRQVVHGTFGGLNGPSGEFVAKALRAHRHISNNMIQLFGKDNIHDLRLT